MEQNIAIKYTSKAVDNLVDKYCITCGLKYDGLKKINPLKNGLTR